MSEYICNNCGNTIDLNICSRCKNVYYCNKICQNEDYLNHKTECLQIYQINNFLRSTKISSFIPNIKDAVGAFLVIKQIKEFLELINGKKFKKESDFYDLVIINENDINTSIELIKKYDHKNLKKFEELIVNKKTFIAINMVDIGYSNILDVDDNVNIQ